MPAEAQAQTHLPNPPEEVMIMKAILVAVVVVFLVLLFLLRSHRI
jgi:uncharacterized membrane protein YidH (DUF202 family)